MTRKRRRLVFVLSGMALIGAAVALVLVALGDSVSFFYSPSDIRAQTAPAGRAIRLGGLVEEGSVARLDDGVTVTFRVTDMAESIPVVYRGMLPDLFREGQGVVTEGRLGSDGVFQAREVLAKHDETYMPPEVADALKRSGHWQPEAGNADQ
ncbi:MAG TPA: cytochrome c maturation protein CcmE [Kiloniellales bacterium]|nr:cytochrome c maturation protein CcmE [Kiloniellales bacterium]